MKRKLVIENYLTIESLELDLNPGVSGFVGANAQGKSNVLKAIEGLLDPHHDPEKIRDGSEKSVLRLEEWENDKLITTVSRIQTKTGSRLVAKGLPVCETPAAYLGKLLDPKMLNPLRIIQDDPVGYLKKHLPAKLSNDDLKDVVFTDSPVCFKPDLDMNGFDYCENAAKLLEVSRKALSQTIRQKQGSLDDMAAVITEEPGPCPYDKRMLQAAMDRCNQKFGEIESETRDYIKKQSEVAELLNEVKAVETTIIKRRAYLQTLEAETKKTREFLAGDEAKRLIVADMAETLQTKIAAIRLPSKDSINAELDSLRSKMKEVDQHERMMAAYDKMRDQAKEIDGLKAKHEIEDRQFKYFRYELPKRLLDRAEIPVDGLRFQDGIMYVGDRRVDLLSESEKARLAFRIALALARLRGHTVVCLDGVEMMDADSRTAWLDEAQKSGLRILYTRTGKPEGEHEKEVRRDA